MLIPSFYSTLLDVSGSTELMAPSLHYYLKHYSISNIIQKHPTLIKLVKSLDLSSILSMTGQRHLNIGSVIDLKCLLSRWCVIPSIFLVMAMRLDSV